MTRPKFGVILGTKAPSSIIRKAAKICDDAGIDSFWIPETTEYGAFSVLGYLASHTKNITLGSGIINVYTRQPKTIKMEAKSLLELSKGRFVLGIGSSAPPLIEYWHGIKFKKPLQTMIQTTKTLREGYDGQIYWAAVNRIMTQNAGRIADGVIFFLKPISVVKQYIEYFKRDASSADNTNIVSFVPTYIFDDRRKAEGMARITIVAYVGGSPFYGKPIVEAGFGESVRKIRDAWAAKDKDLARKSIPDTLVRSIAAFGTVDECVDALKDHLNAGVTHVVAALDLRKDFYGSELLRNLRKFVSKL